MPPIPLAKRSFNNYLKTGQGDVKLTTLESDLKQLKYSITNLCDFFRHIPIVYFQQYFLDKFQEVWKGVN